jgi:hypothetical protein
VNRRTTSYSNDASDSIVVTNIDYEKPSGQFLGLIAMSH